MSPNAMPGWARPIRIPERIEITHAEPAFAIAGEKSTWRLPFRLSKAVPAGAILKCQLWGGRNNKGAFAGAQTERREAEGHLAAELDDGMVLAMSPDKKRGTYVVSLPDAGLKKGQGLTVVLGSRAHGGGGITAWRERMLNKFFILYSVPTEEAEPKFPAWAGGDVWAQGTDDRIVAACTMHILGGATHHIRAYVPATTRPGVPFAVLVRPEDESGCLSHQELAAVDISVNGQLLRADMERIPESTSLWATVRLPAEGVHRLSVREGASGREAVTNPTICARTAQPVYWGMIHGHTEMSDGTGKLDHYFHQLRHEVMLDFAAPGDHDHLWETSDEFWATTCAAVRFWHQPHEFVTFLGYEWAKWRRNGDGDRNVYYLEDDRPLYRSDDGEYPSPPDLFRALTGKQEKAVVIPHHTGHGGNFCDWKDHGPAHERLVEIFQTRGSYECSEQDGNPSPERAGGPAPYTDGYVRRALSLGWRVGFTAGGDDHSGHWGTEFRFGPNGKGYKQGLMSVEAAEKTRQAIFEAMHNRRVVATTGARMLLTYTLNGHPMGSELSVKSTPGLAVRRTLSIAFHGTAVVSRIDIIRSN
ncbi:MAG: DUF3604 domain-containing protein, partial [Planctomycetes bacterium]|nr:DUF3604 domain-containing protein [Planctomycetota bacterium]